MEVLLLPGYCICHHLGVRGNGREYGVMEVLLLPGYCICHHLGVRGNG